jgi:hypothetical protein
LRSPARNTGGVDALFSNKVTFRNFSIAMKANSASILIQDSAFYKGLGVAIDSIGPESF